MQLGVLLYIGRGENRRRDAGKILGELLILQQLRTWHSHQFDADAENADIVYVRGSSRAWSAETDPRGERARLGKDTFAKFCRQVSSDDKLTANDPVSFRVSDALLGARRIVVAHVSRHVGHDRIQKSRFSRQRFLLCKLQALVLAA